MVEKITKPIKIDEIDRYNNIKTDTEWVSQLYIKNIIDKN